MQNSENTAVIIKGIQEMRSAYNIENRRVHLPELPNFASRKIYENEELSVEIIARVNKNIEDTIERLTVDHLIEKYASV